MNSETRKRGNKVGVIGLGTRGGGHFKHSRFLFLTLSSAYLILSTQDCLGGEYIIMCFEAQERLGKLELSDKVLEAAVISNTQGMFL